MTIPGQMTVATVDNNGNPTPLSPFTKMVLTKYLFSRQVSQATFNIVSTTAPVSNGQEIKIRVKGGSYVGVFDGATFVEAGPLSPTTVSGMTISIWFYANGMQPSPDGGLIGLFGISRSGSYYDFFDIVLGSNNNIRFEYSTDTTATSDVFSGSVSLNTWHHVCMSYNGSTAVGYLDGAQVFSAPLTGNIVQQHPIQIGVWDNIFYGKLCDPRVYNRGLTSTEVTQLYQGYDVINGLIARWTFNQSSPNSGLQTETIYDQSWNGNGATVYSGNGLVGHWNFNEGSGTAAYDSSGNGNKGTLVNSPTWVTGKFGEAINFNQGNPTTEQYVDVPYNSSLNITGSFTLSAWFFKTTNRSPHEEDVLRRAEQYSITLTQSNNPPTISWRGANQWNSATVTLALNQWNHVVIIYNQASTTMSCYVNGVLVGQSSGISANNTVDTSSDLTIGDVYAGNGYDFEGVIDEVRIYNRALSDGGVSVGQVAGGEVAALYNASYDSLFGYFDYTSPFMTDVFGGYVTVQPQDKFTWAITAKDYGYLLQNFQAGPIKYYNLAPDLILRDLINKAGLGWGNKTVSQAVTLDGSTGYLASATPPPLWSYIGATITAVCRVNFASLGGTQYLMSDWVANSGFNLIWTGSALQFNVGNGTTTYTLTYTPSPALNLNKWYHIAAVLNEGQMSLYLNGSLVASSNPGPSATAKALSAQPFMIGAYTT